jgi:hypothetical protein
MFRAVNENMRQVNDDFAELTGTFAVACECADQTCLEMIEVPRAVYEDVRQSPHAFVVLAGHVDGEVEQVVGRYDGFVVVEMTAHDARLIIEETTPLRLREHEEQ